MDQAFIEQHYHRIHRMAWMMTGCAIEAEDLAQETFMVALDRWDSFKERSQRATWLIGILMHLKSRRDRTLGRIKRRLSEYFQTHDPCRQTTPETAAMEQEWRTSVWAQVSRLPTKQSEVILLRFVEQLSLDEIALTIGCPQGTAKTRLHHAIKRLEQFPEMKTLQTFSPHYTTHDVMKSSMQAATCETT